MTRSDATFGGSFPYTPHFTAAPGFRMHYVDEGPREAGVVLCLHGEPTWGYLFRRLIPVLSTAHRVVVPDHMGWHLCNVSAVQHDNEAESAYCLIRRCSQTWMPLPH
jgi:hypothetical protein